MPLSYGKFFNEINHAKLVVEDTLSREIVEIIIRQTWFSEAFTYRHLRKIQRTRLLLDSLFGQNFRLEIGGLQRYLKMESFIHVVFFDNQGTNGNHVFYNFERVPTVTIIYTIL